VADTDTLRRFVFERYPFRGQLVHLGPAWQAMMEHHDYPPQVRDTLGEAVVSTALLASTLKFNGLLSLQLRGEGPMHLMLVECTEGLALRAVARYRNPPDTRDLRVLSGDGTLTVTIENEDVVNRYQGIVPLAGASMSECLREYFESSEQLPTRLWLYADARRSSGLLLQRLPVTSKPVGVTESGAGVVPEDEIEDAWQRVQLVAGTVTGEELAELDDRKLLRRLFAEDDVRMFEAAPVFFRCRCSRERVENMLRSLGQAEVDSIIDEFGQVEVRCEFCGRAYRLDAVDAAALFTGSGRGSPGAGSAVH
jgi:molecular chaperone Hsp33